MTKIASAEDYKIVSSFQSLRKTLMEDKFADRLEKPLAYWALPNDRRLPLAFLGRTIKDLLETPFEELSATPGIGQKKISSLVKLLSRATKDQPPAVPIGMNDSLVECARRLRSSPSFPARSTRPSSPRLCGRSGARPSRLTASAAKSWAAWLHATVAADRHLAQAAERLCRLHGRRNSPVADPRREARAGRVGSVLHRA